MENKNPTEFKEFVFSLLDQYFDDIDQEKADFDYTFGNKLTLKQFKKACNEDYTYVIWALTELLSWALKSKENVSAMYEYECDLENSEYNTIYKINDRYYGFKVGEGYETEIHSVEPKYKQVMYF